MDEIAVHPVSRLSEVVEFLSCNAEIAPIHVDCEEI